MRKLARALALAAAALGAACQYSPDIATRAVDYNHDVARATNQIILLNIMRASDRTPRYFTRLGSNSAQNGVTGGAIFTVPLINAGAGNVAASVSGTSANTFTLENLDDKKYQDGAMQPIVASTISELWQQGIQTDMLGLLFIADISIPKSELPILRETLDMYCGDMRHDQKYCGSGQSLIDSEPLANAWKANDCLDPQRVPTDRRGGVDYAVYINDPASEDTSGAYHPELCFQIVLRDLLAIGMHLDRRKTLTDIDSNPSAAALANPAFRAELIKQGLIVEPNGKIGKEGTEIVLALDPASTALIRLHHNFRSVVLRCNVNSSRGVDNDAANHCPAARKAGESVAAYLARIAPAEADYAKLIATDETKANAISLADLKIGIDVRSFESVVYYLGELVRTTRGETGSSGAPYIVRILGRQPWDPAHRSIYEEALFDLRRGSPDANAALVLKDDAGTTNSIPAFCYTPEPPRPSATDAARTCSNQFPDHETLAVLALVNQIWGLQKEPSASPQPILSLGG